MSKASAGLHLDGAIIFHRSGVRVWIPGFDGIYEVFEVAIRAFSVERLVDFDEALRGAREEPLFYTIRKSSPHLLTMAGLVARAQPREFALWSEALPAGTILDIAPGVSLTPPDALLYVAAHGTGDDMVHAMGVAYDMMDRGYHAFGDVDGMRLPELFFAARADLEEEMLRMAAASPEYPGQWSESI